MVFCAYCGKSFTRKEHLERHIPSHTNVKPHRCSSCQLSFSRRDLLQRHCSTYHEAKDQMQPVLVGPPIVAGRTPIACSNCASAKTGCDKRVPCSRCAEKSLPCAARFARRSTKAIHRAVTWDGTVPPALPSGNNPVDQGPAVNVCGPTQAVFTQPLIDPQLQSSSDLLASPTLIRPMDTAARQLMKIDGFDELIQYHDILGSSAVPNFQPTLACNGFSMDVDFYSNLPLVPMEDCQPILTNNDDILYDSEIAFSSSQNSISRLSSRSSSITSHTDTEISEDINSKCSETSPAPTLSEFDEVLAAESAWPLARCNKPSYSGSCPRTAIVHLETLERKSRSNTAWNTFHESLGEEKANSFCPISVKSVVNGTRDKLLAITQSFLHRALKTHRSGLGTTSTSSHTSTSAFSFLVLPPPEILEYFVKSYACSLLAYYSLTAGQIIDINDLMHDNQASALLVLLMIAQGASTVSTDGARFLSAGLTETCRISLFDIIEKDIEICADPIVLQCALLFTIIGAWGGDKWHMDIVMGQRGIYLAMLKHSGLLEEVPQPDNLSGDGLNIELQWRSWQRLEFKKRLVYSWVMVDQELALFHDCGTILSITELHTPLPNPDDHLWDVKTSEEWASFIPNTTQAIISLHTLFRNFLTGDIDQTSGPLNPLYLRLLLHPIQCLLTSTHQTLSCFPEAESPRRGSETNNSELASNTTTRTLTKSSTLHHIEEVQSLLQKWYDLCQPHIRDTADDSPQSLLTTTNLIIYHLLSLNVITSFSTIERLARSPHAYPTTSTSTSPITHHSSSIFHAGQVLRLTNALATPQSGRPQWLPVAIYRATMILWMNSLSVGTVSASVTQPQSLPIPLDMLSPDDPNLVCWLWSGEGLPMISGEDGSQARLDAPAEILACCISLVKRSGEGRLAEGIVRKLTTLGKNWHG